MSHYLKEMARKWNEALVNPHKYQDKELRETRAKTLEGYEAQTKRIEKLMAEMDELVAKTKATAAKTSATGTTLASSWGKARSHTVAIEMDFSSCIGALGHEALLSDHTVRLTGKRTGCQHSYSMRSFGGFRAMALGRILQTFLMLECEG